MNFLRPLFLSIFLVACLAARDKELTIAKAQTPSVQERKASHTNNWAVIVCASRSWFNYRDVGNALSLYRTVRRLGIPDDHIILMLADNIACNARNPYPAQIFNEPDHALDIYGANVEVDYRGAEVTVESLIRVLTGRHHPSVPRSKRLLTDSGSNVLLFLSGHGGDGFLKFQDVEEMQSHDLADAIHQMHQKNRYHSLLLMVDTCQAATLPAQIYSPGVVTIASSRKGENSYSHHLDQDVGVSLVDRFTHYTLHFFETSDLQSNASLARLFGAYNPKLLDCTPVVRRDLFEADLESVAATEYFGAVMRVEHTRQSYPSFTGRQFRGSQNKLLQESGDISGSRQVSASQQDSWQAKDRVVWPTSRSNGILEKLRNQDDEKLFLLWRWDDAELYAAILAVSALMLWSSYCAAEH